MSGVDGVIMNCVHDGTTEAALEGGHKESRRRFERRWRVNEGGAAVRKGRKAAEGPVGDGSPCEGDESSSLMLATSESTRLEGVEAGKAEMNGRLCCVVINRALSINLFYKHFQYSQDTSQVV